MVMSGSQNEGRVSKLVATIALGFVGLALVAQPAASAKPPPTPEEMQAWAAKPRKYKSATESTLEGLRSVGYDEETFYGSPVGVLHALDQGWGQILDKLNADDQTAAADRGHNCAEFAEAIRGIATRSPDEAYNKLVKKAVDRTQDTCDEVDKLDLDAAAKKTRGLHRSWAAVEQKLEAYGFMPTVSHLITDD